MYQLWIQASSGLGTQNMIKMINETQFVPYIVSEIRYSSNSTCYRNFCLQIFYTPYNTICVYTYILDYTFRNSFQKHTLEFKFKKNRNYKNSMQMKTDQDLSNSKICPHLYPAPHFKPNIRCANSIQLAYSHFLALIYRSWYQYINVRILSFIQEFCQYCDWSAGHILGK